MRTVTVSGTEWPLLDTVSLAAGERLQITVRLPVPAALPSCLAKGQVALIAQTPGTNAAFQSSPVSGTATPGFTVSGDSPFFAIS